MTGMGYQLKAMRTNDGQCSERLVNFVDGCSFLLQDEKGYPHKVDAGGVVNACLGLSGEVGEVNDLIKKSIFHEKSLEYVHLRKEIGDVMWYIALLCHSFGFDLDEIMQLNITKLENRFPEGFNPDRANNKSKEDV